MKKILIVEDDILAAELERDYLEASDYEVELCGDGDEGYKKAESGIYDLLLLDIMLRMFLLSWSRLKQRMWIWSGDWDLARTIIL